MGPRELETHIDNACSDLKLKVEDLNRLFKIALGAGGTEHFINMQNVPSGSLREKQLEKAVREAAAELGETKKYFKSKTIKEVREKLIKAIE